VTAEETIAKFKQAYEEAIEENKLLHDEAVEMAQEIEELEQELQLAESDMQIILSEMGRQGLDMQFVLRLKKVVEE
jgi:hypothetical protein